MADKPVIRLLNAGLSEDDTGEIIAVGFLDVDSLQNLKVDDYQREFLGGIGNKPTKISQAVETGVRLPSIVIGMRGERFTSRGDTMALEDDCYIIDGLQRVFTIRKFAEKHLTKASGLRLGAEVRFNTTKESEKALFHVLNAWRTSMSGNILLRNKRDKSKAIAALYSLTVSDSRSPLFRKVTWNQRMARSELFTAIAIVRVALTIHANNGSPAQASSRGNIDYAADALTKVADKVGVATLKDNVATFFEALNDVFDTDHIEFRSKATVIKVNFMLSVAQLFAEHQNFWYGSRLVVPSVYKKKLAQFPIRDHEVMRLAGSGNMAIPLLYKILCDFMDKGKRTNRLHKKVPKVKSKD